jgi:hypothetical protein
MEKTLKEVEVGLRERRFEDLLSRTEGVNPNKDADFNDKQEPDYLPGSLINQQGQWAKVESLEPKGIILNDRQVRIMSNYVNQAILSTQKNLKRQFWSFLRCASAAEIAKKANCTRANVHKYFQKAIKKILTLMSKDLSESDLLYNMTPKKFKENILL